MDQETRYRYEKRTEELRKEIQTLRGYKMLAIYIFNTVTDRIHEGKQISLAWIVKQYRDVMK